MGARVGETGTARNNFWPNLSDFQPRSSGLDLANHLRGCEMSMSEKAKALGIPERDLRQAMILVRDLRIAAINEGLDPRATRIALIYANLADLHFARTRLSPKDLAALEEIAKELYSYAKDRF